GAYVAYLEFEDGTPATAIYSGYAHFDTSELTFDRGAYRRPRVSAATTVEEEAALKESLRYAEEGETTRGGDGDNTLGLYGPTIVTCARADLRESPAGLFVYEEGGRLEIPAQTADSLGDNELETV